MIQILIVVSVMQIVIFVAAVVAFRFIYARQISESMQRVKALDQQAQVKEKYLQQELARIEQERQAALAQAKEEATRLIEQAKRTGEIVRRNEEDKARQEADALMAAGKEELLVLKRSLFDVNRSYIFELTREVFVGVCSEYIRQEVHRSLIREIIAACADVALPPAGENSAAIISVVQPLHAEERAALSAVLTKKTGAPVRIEERMAKELVGGMIIQLGAVVIDGSLKHKIDSVIERLKTT